jgi:D-cysteine desulfhydrase
VVTAGGIQSNHCRATALAARSLGLDAHLLLRTRRAALRVDPGGVGNLLPERMAGAEVHLVSREQYARLGSAALLETQAARLRAAGRNPYVIPVGGSDGTGSWGYLEFVDELRRQLPASGIDALALACGSGGTVAGAALGCHLAGLRCAVLAFGVCDDPEYFRGHVRGICDQMGVSPADAEAALATVRFVQARGAGYAQSTAEELASIAACARATGILLDPVYTGKAYHALLAELASGAWAGRTVAFLHTGGLLGAADAADKLLQASAQLCPLHAAPLLPDEASGSDSDAA